MLQCQPAARTNLHFISGWNFKRQPGWNSLRDSRFQQHGANRSYIHAGIFSRPMRVLRQMRAGVKLLDSNAHYESAIIARCRAAACDTGTDEK